MSNITKHNLQDAQAFLSDLAKKQIEEQVRYITCTIKKPIESIDDLCELDKTSVVQLINMRIHFNTLFKFSVEKINQLVVEENQSQD